MTARNPSPSPLAAPGVDSSPASGAGPWWVVTDAAGPPSRVECDTVAEVVRIYAATLDAWVYDDRFTAAWIEDAAGGRYLPTVERSDFGFVTYRPPLIPQEAP